MMTRSRALQILYRLIEDLEETHSTLHGTLNTERLAALRIAIHAVERETEVKKPLRGQP